MGKIFLVLMGVAVGAVGVSLFVSTAIQRNEIAECNILQKQAAEIEDFWIVPWQRDMCDAHGIDTGAKWIRHGETQ